MILDDTLQQFRRTLNRDYVASAIIGLDGMHLSFDTAVTGINGDRLAAELADGLKDVMEMVRETNSGDLHYLNINTDKYRILLLPLGADQSKVRYFCTLAIKQDGNVGKAILELEKAQKILAKEMNL